jgi:Ca-activated chloride channel family protein
VPAAGTVPVRIGRSSPLPTHVSTRLRWGLAALLSALVVCPAAAQDPASGTEPETAAEPVTQAPAGGAGEKNARKTEPGDAGETAAENGSADPAASGEGRARVLPQEFNDWLLEVDPLITTKERVEFLKLEKDYQRHAFIRYFWRSRDPYPQTARNELKDRWEARIDVARARYGSLRDDRARVLLLHGPPQNAFQVRCTTTRSPAEVWLYTESEQVNFPFLLIFVRLRGKGEARVYRPTTINSLQRATLAAARDCLHGDRLTQVLAFADDPNSGYEQKLVQALAKPKPRSSEWVDNFAAYSTEIPAKAETFDAKLAVSFLGRHDNRTVVQGLVQVSAGEAEVADFAGHKSYDFLLNGEVVLGDDLFENFRYQFGFPAGSFRNERLPLAFQRYLRPGEYTMLLRLEDLNSGAFYRVRRELEVPALEEIYEVPDEIDSETAALFEEATAAIQAGETTLRIVPPRGDIQTGFVRIDTLASGDVDKVRFLLDGREVMTRNRPPFNVEIDFGQFPRRHFLRAEAFDEEGEQVAFHEIELNSGRNRFDIRLLEPRRGQHYERSLRARAEVDVPDGQEVDRVEFFLDDMRVATLHQPPYVQPIALPDRMEAISYVRAVAYLPDGNSTEDVAFVNAPEYMEEIDVQLVELYTTVLGGDGRPLRDLTEGDFKVLEDGKEQEIERFDRVEDLPIHAGILIDTSGSMRRSLSTVRQAALRFLEQAITPKDRAAVITFSKFPRLAVKLTNDLTKLGGGLAGLAPEGETALYDSLIFSLYYFTGIRGQRAILLLSDGQDESSEFSFEETLEYARRAGVTIYSIGLSLGGGEARGKLDQLSRETGGRSFFIHSVEELPEIYRLVQEELRSQYLIAYQSSNTSGSGDFRTVELRLPDRPKAKVNTISGYYP